MADSSKDEMEGVIALENALIALVVQHGARTVAEKAQELYQHTKEWRDQQSAQPNPAEDDVWDRASRAHDARTQAVGGRRQSAFENARRLLGG